MMALVLAAGMGNRLGTFTTDRPKALVEVAGRPLIAHTLDFLHRPEITAIGVVGGFCYERLHTTLRVMGPDVTCMYNPHFRQGSIETLFVARAFLTESFLLLNADHLYRSAMIDHICVARQGVTAMCDFDRTLCADDMKIAKNKRGGLERIHKTLSHYDGGYIGITYCPKDCHAAYWAAAEATHTEFGPSAPVEWILGTLARAGHPIAIGDMSGIGWAEVDTPEDLRRAEQFLNDTHER